MPKSDFLDLIIKQRNKKKQKKFKGTFLDYLDLVRDDPKTAKLAHVRLRDAIESHGSSYLSESDPRCRSLFDDEKVKTYDYFEEEFFGMERVISKIMRYLNSAAARGEESRQVLLLLGPVGAGKSALTEHIKRALELAPPFFHLEGDPMRAEPLHLLPRALRPEFEELLGLKIEGDINPLVRDRLMEEFNGEYEKYPVVQTTFSQRGRRGISSVPPMDPNTQDVSILIGSEDISKLDLYPEDDPRVLSLNGAFNVGNRGIVEFVDDKNAKNAFENLAYKPFRKNPIYLEWAPIGLLS